MNDVNKFIAKKCRNDKLFMSTFLTGLDIYSCVENLTNLSINNLVPNIIKFPNFFIPEKKNRKITIFGWKEYIILLLPLLPLS